MLNTESLDLMYEYNQFLIDRATGSVNRLDTKLSAFIGFSGLLLRLAIDIPTEHYVLLKLLQITICSLSSLTITLCVWGLIPKNRREMLNPKNFLHDTWSEQATEEHKKAIINSHLDLLEEYQSLGEIKRRFFIKSLILFGTALVIFGIAVCIPLSEISN